MLLSLDMLNKVSTQAKESPRLRMSFYLHESYEDSIQRMINAIEPESIMPIARHRSCSETLILLQGKLRVLIFDDMKRVIEDVVLDKALGNIGYHIPDGVWHKVESLESGTVLFETREGPYEPVKPEDILV